MDYSAYLVPLLLAFTALFGLWKRVNVYDALSLGAREGLDILLGILPNLVGLMTAVYMLRASGALDLAAQALTPLLDRIGLPGELLPLMLVRPISGSAALGGGAELIAAHGPDSYLGRTAAVVLGMLLYLQFTKLIKKMGKKLHNSVKRGIMKSKSR